VTGTEPASIRWLVDVQYGADAATEEEAVKYREALGFEPKE